MNFQRILIPLFIFFWWKSLHNTETNTVPSGRRSHIVKVQGWRCALVDEPGRGRMTVRFCPLWFK